MRWLGGKDGSGRGCDKVEWKRQMEKQSTGWVRGGLGGGGFGGFRRGGWSCNPCPLGKQGAESQPLPLPICMKSPHQGRERIRGGGGYVGVGAQYQEQSQARRHGIGAGGGAMRSKNEIRFQNRNGTELAVGVQSASAEADGVACAGGGADWAVLRCARTSPSVDELPSAASGVSLPQAGPMGTGRDGRDGMGWDLAGTGTGSGTGTGEIKSEDKRELSESSGPSVPILIGGLLPPVCRPGAVVLISNNNNEPCAHTSVVDWRARLLPCPLCVLVHSIHPYAPHCPFWRGSRSQL